jgi:hypothetical protein
MSKLFILALVFFLSLSANAQVSIGTPSPHASSVLELASNSKGLLVPRMIATDRALISSPATGLLVYQTDGAAGFYFYNGGWTKLASATVPVSEGGTGATTAANAINNLLPAQAGNNGKLLSTNGSTASWVTPATASATAFGISNSLQPVTTDVFADVAGTELTLVAGKTYQLDGAVIVSRSGAASGTLKFRWVYSGTATTGYGLTLAGGLVPGTTLNSAGSHNTEVVGLTTSATTTPSEKVFGGYLTATTGGVLKLQIALAAADPDPAQIHPGSYLVARPLN